MLPQPNRFNPFVSQSPIRSVYQAQNSAAPYLTPSNIETHKEYQIALDNMRMEMEKSIDSKMNNNNLRFFQENNQKLRILAYDIELNNKKVLELEGENLKLREEIQEKYHENKEFNKNPSFSSNPDSHEVYEDLSPGTRDKIEDLLGDHEKIKIYKEELEVDSYLYLSIAFSVTTLPMIFVYIYVILTKEKMKLWSRLKSLFAVILSPLLLVPGLATSVIQVFCANLVYEEALSQYSQNDKSNLQTLKILMLIIFLFMVARETTQAINNFFFCLIHSKKKSQFFIAGCFLPALIQILIAFFILDVSFLLIASTDDSIDLIQNFAGVYILLEIDNIMMDFLRLSKLSIFILKCNEKLQKLRSFMGISEVFSSELTKKILIKKDLEINYEDHHPYYKIAFLVIRVSIIVSLILYSTLVWIYSVEEIDTSQKDGN